VVPATQRVKCEERVRLSGIRGSEKNRLRCVATRVEVVRCERALSVSAAGGISSRRPRGDTLLSSSCRTQGLSSVQVELMCCAVNGRALAVTCAIVGDQR